jgi:hypothetical protein
MGGLLDTARTLQLLELYFRKLGSREPSNNQPSPPIGSPKLLRNPPSQTFTIPNQQGTTMSTYASVQDHSDYAYDDDFMLLRSGRHVSCYEARTGGSNWMRIGASEFANVLREAFDWLKRVVAG